MTILVKLFIDILIVYPYNVHVLFDFTHLKDQLIRYSKVVKDVLLKWDLRLISHFRVVQNCLDRVFLAIQKQIEVVLLNHNVDTVNWVLSEVIDVFQNTLQTPYCVGLVIDMLAIIIDGDNLWSEGVL